MEVDRTQTPAPPSRVPWGQAPALSQPAEPPPQDVPTEDGFSSALQHSMRFFNGEDTAGEGEPPPAEPGPPGDQPPAPAGPPPTPLRFTTQEEAERAHREAEQRMHQSTQEAASLRRYVETLELRLRDLETHGQSPAAATRPGATEQPSPQPTAPPAPINVRERLKRAYQEASALDPEADNYYGQQQDILVNAQAEILENLLQQPRLTEEQITHRIQQGIQQAQQDWQRQTRQQTDSQRQTQKLLDAATAAGLDVRPPPDDGRGFAGLHYNDLMFAVANDMYPANATEDEAITHVVNLVRDRWGVQAPATNQSPNGTPPPAQSTTPAPWQQSARQAQTSQAPLERSGMGRPAATPQQAQPMSMSEAIEGTMRPRRP